MEPEIHRGGMFVATGIVGIATLGTHLTTFRGDNSLNSVWLGGFGLGWIVLSAAMVNFDPKRWLW